ncbi:MAG: efflux RND transporter permease subunit [Elusimicrobiota bacterium]
MKLSDISIKNPVFAWMLMIGLIVFGALSFERMGVSQLPDVDFPVITVTVTWEGASPDVMESAVADIIEDAVMSVDGVQLVQSVSQEGQTQIIIQLDLNQDINTALEEVQTYVTEAQKNLPQTIDPPVITKTNPDDQPIMWTAVYGSDVSLRDIALFVRDHLKDAITTVNGVGNVFLGGYVDPQMRIWANNKAMVKREITVQDIINAVNTEHELTPTGYQDDGPTETYVRVHSQFKNAGECDKLIIPSREGLGTVWKRIRLGDVAKCEEGTDEVRRISRYNGIFPTMGVGVIKQHGTNAVAIAQMVKAKIKALQPLLPKGMNMDIVIDTTKFIKASINDLIFTLIAAVLFTSLVCYLFLGSWSSALNVILAIPVSVIGSFIFLNAFGFTLNSFTLLALSLSIGIVVDDAIMVLENIVRYNEMGMPRVQASIVGAREITTAAVASSLAILAIFTPVVFMRGIVGKFFYQFGVAMSVAILISLLEALTLAPMRCSQFLSVGRENWLTRKMNAGMDSLAKRYRGALEWCLDRRWTVIATALMLTFASYGIAVLLRKEFLPPQDQSEFLVTLYTKMGSSLDYTDGVFLNAEKILKTRPEVAHYYQAVGGFGGGLVNQGIMFVVMKDPSQRPFAPPFHRRPTQQEFMQFIRKKFGRVPGVERVAILDLSLAGFSAQRGYPIEFEVQGPDWNKLVGYSTDIFQKLKGSKLMADLDTDYNPDMPETEIYPDRDKAAKMGVPVTTISDTISALVGGIKLLPNKYTDSAGHRDDIQVKLLAEQNETAADIDKIWVRNVQGEMIPLKDLVIIHPGKTLLTITRYNRERGIGIFGNFAKGRSESDVIAYIQKLADQVLPKGEGYHVVMSGSSQAFQDSFRSLLFALALGIFAAYIVLASQFNSFVHPFTVLMALPFSIAGALWALYLTNTSLNIYSLIGILLLMGIVKKNSILLVDFTNERRNAGKGLRESLLEACPIRLRPILMTTAATLAGAIPEALAIGPGSEIIRPMAIAVIGGILVSVNLTLFVVPCIYSLMSSLENGGHRKRLREALTALGEK